MIHPENLCYSATNTGGSLLALFMRQASMLPVLLWYTDQLVAITVLESCNCMD